MLPVRWKLTAATILYLIHITVAARTPKDLTDNGWKPIIGHTAGSNFDIETINYQPTNKNEKINFNLRKATTQDVQKHQVLTSPKPAVTYSINSIGNQHGHAHLNKMSSSGKQQLVYVTGQGYNVQKPMNTIAHRSQSKLHKIPVMGKNHVPVSINGKRVIKPVRVQTSAYSQKDEILAPAPSTGLGNYAFFNPALGSVKTRHPQHSTIDYLNHFSSQSGDPYQFQRLPIQQYVLPKNQAHNDAHYTFQVQNDEYSRNLVPPPPSKQYTEKEKPKEKPILFKQKEQIKTVTETTQANKQRAEQSQILSDTALFNLPSPYQHTTYYVPSTNEQAVDVQVTKENIKEFHNNIPYQQQDIYNSAFGNYQQFGKKPTETPRIPTYEVTEEKDWREVPPSFNRQHFLQEVKNFEKVKLPVVKQHTQNIEQFLPTPIKPSVAIPTSPTQSEISTIFTELSQKINRQKENMDTTFFNVKDVSTHYPILGRPDVGQFNVQYSIPIQDDTDFPNEITTIRPKNQYRVKQVEITTEMATTTPAVTTITSTDWPQKRRPSHRRRRPINRNKPTTEEASTTTTEYNFQREIEQTTVKGRRRRPTEMQKTTEVPAFVEKPIKRNRYRQRIRPTVESIEEDMPHNHKMSFSEDISQPIRGSYTYKTSTETGRKRPVKYYSSTIRDEMADEEYPTSTKYKVFTGNKEKVTKPQNYYLEEPDVEENYQLEENVEEMSGENYENKKMTSPRVYDEPTTLTLPFDNSEFITIPNHEEIQDDRITIKEVYTAVPEIPDDETTLATTTALTTTTTTTTTTTAEPKTTTKSNRFRRPIHYKPPRPKFSVKDYHQRLNQYISSTEAPKVSTESTRHRLQYRTRRPIVKQEEQGEEITEPTKRRFVPKSQRQQQPIPVETKDEPVETSMKTVNSRLRPFSRHRSTTTDATTTTQRVSIKPKIFNTLRRPPPLSLKERIQNKYNKSNNNEEPIKVADNDEKDETEEITTEVLLVPTTTEIPTTIRLPTTTSLITTTRELESTIDDTENEDTRTIDILKNDALLQSQRVSDLTSSTQNQYNTPGMFKNVSPNVRRVPNYFTLATDDPILPIEAFFPNINKEKYQ